MAINIHNLLSDALLELCNQKPLTSITIKELLEKAGVSRQACAIREQNCLVDFMFLFVVDYDIKWHQHHNNGKPLSEEQLFATKYHSIASIQVAIDWISCDNPAPPEVMARRITNIRKISLSNTLFGSDCNIYNIE